MTTLKIENLLGIKRAEIELDGILEVVGPNASGKSSLAACAQALLAHEQNPLGVSATQAKRVYMHDGEDGMAELDGVEWRPGKGLTVTNGQTPLSRPAAVGLVDYTAKLGEKERLESLQSALLPDVAEIIDAMRKRLLEYMPTRDVDGLLEMIGERGFDAAGEVYGERGREAKRQWQEVTNRTYGVKVASDWRPDGWLADMDDMTTAQAEDLVAAAREALAALHQVQAVTEAQAQQGADAKSELPELQERLSAAREAAVASQASLDALPLGNAKATVKEIEGRLASYRKDAMGSKALTCPHCQGFVAWNPDEGGLDPFDGEAERLEKQAAAVNAKEAEAGLADAISHVTELQVAVENGQTVLNLRDTEWSNAKTALAVAELLAKDADAQVETAGRRADLMQAEQATDDAKRVSAMVSAEARAAELSETIARYTEVVRALGPQGVRAGMMGKGLARLNAGLEVIGEEAGWPVAEVTERGGVMWATRPVQLCSASEQWRAQAAIQLTLAALTGSGAVVLDRADLLDAGNREGLVRAVKRVAGKTGIAVLLCSTGVADGSAPWKQVAIAGGATA